MRRNRQAEGSVLDARTTPAETHEPPSIHQLSRRRLMQSRMRAVLLGLACAAGATPGAAQAIHPVLDAKSGFVLGAPVNGTWRDGQHVARQVGAGRRYRVFGQDGPLGVSTGSRAAAGEDVCPETFAV